MPVRLFCHAVAQIYVKIARKYLSQEAQPSKRNGLAVVNAETENGIITVIKCMYGEMFYGRYAVHNVQLQ